MEIPESKPEMAPKKFEQGKNIPNTNKPSKGPPMTPIIAVAAVSMAFTSDVAYADTIQSEPIMRGMTREAIL